MRRRTRLRAGLAFRTTIQFAVGCWTLFLPRSFFDIPWVGMRMPYNEHLMLDYGAMSLATSVVLGAGAVTMRRSMADVARTTYLVFAVAHFVIHLRFLYHLLPAEATVPVIALGMMIAIPSVLLVRTKQGERHPAVH